MTKEEFYKLIKNVNKDAYVVITWSKEEKECLQWHKLTEVKVNLTSGRLELSIDDC